MNEFNSSQSSNLPANTREQQRRRNETSDALNEFGLSGDEAAAEMATEIRQQAFDYHPDQQGSRDEFRRYKECRRQLVKAFNLNLPEMP